MNKIKNFITKEKINYDTKLNYLITIPCVNREERNAINVIDKTFSGFEKSGLFESNINLTILLFESGSKDLSYLNFIKQYIDKYNSQTNIKINIIYSNTQLNGNTNTLRMFYYISKLEKNLYDFVIWMDDDIYVCKNFIKNADIWIKNYANYSIFSSLYVPYNSFYIKNRKYIQLANLPGFYGTCCTIFKPQLSKFILPHWNDKHFIDFEYNPDARFRDCVRKFFPNAHKICVSYPSLVEHMNIGSAIKGKKVVNKGHKAKYFIGEDNDPELYINDLIL
jgi:hypothetical protein